MEHEKLGESERRLIQQEMFQLEDQKQALEEQYQYLFDNALSGLFRIDPQKKTVLTANKELLRTFKVDQLVELDYLFDRYGIFDELVELVDDPDQPEPMIFSSPLLLGSDERMIQFSAKYHGENHVIEGAAKDITGLVMAEKRMLEAIREAEQANHAKSLFLANMSHEIRTPLNGIVGYAELIQREGEGKIHVFADKILDESNRLMTLINQLLDISKIEANQIQLEQDFFSVGELVREQMGLFKRRLEEKGLRGDLEEDQDLAPFYRGDAFRIGQIISNLLSNAVKFTARGKVTLTVSLEEREESADQVRFTVSDTGIGIPREKHGSVFEKFMQADSSIERRFGGTGLGIAICKELVELMGGSITLKSRVGAGSTFSFVLPLERGEGERMGTTPSLFDESPVRELPPARILLVEDYKVNQEVVLLQLKEFPLRIDVAENGEAAIGLFKANRYDLILMDVHMPLMSGLEATRCIRGFEKGQDIPIIGMSASAFYTDKMECRRVGMNDFLSKPLRRQTLIKHLNFWLTEGGESRNRFWEEPVGPTADEGAAVLRYPEFCKEMESIADANGIIEGFLSSAQDVMEKLFHSLKKEEWKEAHRHAHSLKGGALNLMADELSLRAQRLELALKEPQGRDIMPLYHNVSRSLNRLKGEYQRILEGESFPP